MLGKRFPNTRIGSGLQTIIVDHPHASDLTASSMQGTEWMTGVRAYYFGKYGDPDREAQFSDQSGKKIEVYKWAKNRTGEGVTIYATDGANNCLGDAAMGCEFFIGLTPDVDEIVEAVAEAGLCGNGTSEIPASGDTITLAYPLWNGAESRTFMFTDGRDILPPFQPDEKKIEFVQLVPLFESERQFKTENGEAALWTLFEKHEVPYWRSNRQKAF